MSWKTDLSHLEMINPSMISDSSCRVLMAVSSFGICGAWVRA
jgi:hypothetical protein